MANIGSCNGTATGFAGAIRALALGVEANIVAGEHKACAAAPAPGP